jgi:YD repeat-containing protein
MGDVLIFWGNVILARNAIGNKTQFTYDANSHLTSVTDPTVP